MIIITYIFLLISITSQFISITQSGNCIETFNIFENTCINSPGELIGVNIPEGYRVQFYSDPYCSGRLGRYAWGRVHKAGSPYFYQSIKILRDYDNIYDYEGEISTPVEHMTPHYYHRSWNGGWDPVWSQQLAFYN